jgi:hypothetical protein
MSFHASRSSPTSLLFAMEIPATGWELLATRPFDPLTSSRSTMDTFCAQVAERLDEFGFDDKRLAYLLAA